jgi:hypothetical protein
MWQHHLQAHSLDTYIVVILPPQVDSINIHAPIISPIVRQRNNELHTHFRRGIDDFVESRNVYRRLTIRAPALEDDFRAAGAFAAVLGQAGRVVGGVLVVEAPGAEDLEAGLFGGGEAEFDVCLVVVEGEVLEELTLSACVCGSFWLAGWLLSKCCGGFRTHVGVAAGEVEVFAVQFELCSGGRHEAFRGFAGRKSCYCAYKQGDGGEVDQHLVVRRSRASE